MLFLVAIVIAAPAAASPLVTGNGFGFAVVQPAAGIATRFYSHPHSFMRADPANPLSEGIATPNFIKSLSFGAPGKASADYVADSHVIRVRRGALSGTIFMPFGIDRPALVISGAVPWRLDWSAPLRGQSRIGAARLLRFMGIDEPLLLIPLAPTQSSPASQPLAASSAWVLVALERPADASAAVRDVARWRAGLSPAALTSRELAQFERWRVKPTVRFTSEAERHLWRQSKTILRIAQSREPNRPARLGRPARYGNGLIVGALPDTYATPWVRDMAWATVALARMGHRWEARAALLAYFNARPTGVMKAQVDNVDYQISVVRYWGGGAEEPFFTQEGATNIEFDDWGEALWALGEYVRRYDDPALLRAATARGPLYGVARDFIVAPLLANTEAFGPGRIVAKDTSIWEEHQPDAKHFAFTTAMGIVGLRAFADIAARAGDSPARTNALTHAAALQRGFDSAFIRAGQLRGTLEPNEKNDIDGALLPIINFGLVRDAAIVGDTLARMERLKMVSGGYRRVTSNYTDPKIFEYWYERQEFLFVDFHWAELQRRLGNNRAADAMLARIVAKAAADHNTIPEMYVSLPCELFPGAIGDPTGAMPMVGYGAGAFVLHLLDRHRPS